MFDSAEADSSGYQVMSMPAPAGSSGYHHLMSFLGLTCSPIHVRFIPTGYEPVHVRLSVETEGLVTWCLALTCPSVNSAEADSSGYEYTLTRWLTT